MKIETRGIVHGWTLYTLTNNNSMSVKLLDFGGIITEINVPNRDKTVENVVLGYNNYADYEENPNYFGAIVGRVAGRIKGASFELNGKTHSLEKNEGNHHLHGGSKGFHQVIWTALPFQTTETVGVTLTNISLDGEGGYPGTVEVDVTYTLTNNNELILDYFATTDKTTALTLTNHSYFNLSGNLAETIHNHHVTMSSDELIELDNELIPTGNKVNVSHTSFDFRKGRRLGNYPYDHYFIFNQKKKLNVSIKDETSGRLMAIRTNQPGVVMYSANGLGDDLELAEGQSKPFLGVCFETQASPASLHHEGFPTVVLKADETYEKQTVFSFGVEG